jgi:hypothetical protein
MITWRQARRSSEQRARRRIEAAEKRTEPGGGVRALGTRD